MAIETKRTLNQSNINPSKPLRRPKIVISNAGEYEVENQTSIVRPIEFSINTTEIPMRKALAGAFKPDLTEIFILFSALIINLLVIPSFTGLSLSHPYMLVYWGLISLLLYTLRWSHLGINNNRNSWQFSRDLKRGNNELMTGVIMELKLIGIICSIVLITVGGIY